MNRTFLQKELELRGRRLSEGEEGDVEDAAAEGGEEKNGLGKKKKKEKTSNTNKLLPSYDKNTDVFRMFISLRQISDANENGALRST